MVHKTGNGTSVVGPKKTHRCSLSCLGPLTFHPHAVGDMVHLSQGCRLAKRTENTFKNGLVFSSRPVKIQERIRLRVEKDLSNWHGALRLGFTNVPPSARSLPLPIMAIPDLTDTQGHWAAPVTESLCQAGSELEFWVSARGVICITDNNTQERKLLTGVDLALPLWAMIDIYGQTCSISLLGSEKRERFRTRRSCPAPECLTSSDNCCSLIPDVSRLSGNSDEHVRLNAPEYVMDCVVCMDKQASVTLPCGHQCLCSQCADKVFLQFNTCPLCRQSIKAMSLERRCLSVGLL